MTCAMYTARSFTKLSRDSGTRRPGAAAGWPLDAGAEAAVAGVARGEAGGALVHDTAKSTPRGAQIARRRVIENPG